MLVAVRDGCVVGFVTLATQRHFTGQVDAAESWARERGLRRITLETGAANVRARSFYQALGYAEEEVRLSRPVSIDDQAASACLVSPTLSLMPGTLRVRHRPCLPAGSDRGSRASG
ncbi:MULTISPECIES: GNAT family N-acetyltransferase [unclassified Nonomuraea]|uniref:GNAT family N-acetyltransferase n=1 Tax=unclassified Nonomuraea TaxID=2593643 RepID=UPI0033CF340D